MKKILLTIFVFTCITSLRADEKIKIFKSDQSVAQFSTASVDSMKLDAGKTTLIIYQTNASSLCIPLAMVDSITITPEAAAQSVQVRTTTVSQILFNSAMIGLELESGGSSSILEQGICWNTQSTPTTNHSKTVVTAPANTSCIPLTGLNSNTSYYARAYAITSSKETIYGNEMMFATQSNLPIIQTLSADYLRAENSVTCTGNVVNQGTSAVLERGFCWSTTTIHPTISDSKLIHSQSTTGSFVLTKNNLGYETDYYVRAYATNAHGTSYGKTVRVIPLKGDVKYHFAGGANPGDMGEYQFNLLKQALDSACYYMNRYTGYVANIRIDYHPGVPTAEASLWGQMKWGANERYMYVGTVMHEMCHYFGSGQHWWWLNHQSNGFNLPATNALVTELTGGVVTKLSAGGGHFWPFGCNQREEVAAGIDGRFANEQYLTIMAKLIWEMRIDCYWATGE